MIPGITFQSNIATAQIRLRSCRRTFVECTIVPDQVSPVSNCRMSLVGTIHVFLDTRLGKERDESSNNQRGTDCHSMIGMCCLRAQESVTSPERILFNTNLSFQNI